MAALWVEKRRRCVALFAIRRRVHPRPQLAIVHPYRSLRRAPHVPPVLRSEKSAPTEVGDLNQAHYQSSSSGNSSPARDAEPLGPITVEDIDMWE
eukprot:2256854-Prymnesium_polylepis.1